MSSPQRCPGELQEESNGAKRVCLRAQHKNLTREPKAAILECPSVNMESRGASSEGEHTTVGSSAASLRSTGVTKEAFVATVESKGAMMESSVVAAILEVKSATSGVEGATLGSNTTLGSDSVALETNNTTLASNDSTLRSNNATLESNYATFRSNDATFRSNDATFGSNDATLESNDVSLGSNDATLEFIDGSLGSSSASMKSTGACETVGGSNVQVSVIIPVYNGAQWLDECLQAVLDQDFRGTLEISVFDDASTDNSRAIAESWRERLRMRGVTMVISGHNRDRPRGVGFAKNKAVAQSSGRYLCFQDADDVMLPQRVRLQYEAAVLNPDTIVGCRVRRVPEGSTERYTRWINTLSPEQLLTQVYTSHGPTVVMPTWFCSRCWFHKVGPFDEGGKGVPEDLLWFYQSLRRGGGVIRVDECILIYRYHEHAATHSVLEETIWKLRVDFLEERVLGQWDSFTVWNAGKQGRKLYRSLASTNQKKVKAFCDVDENKIKKGFYTYEDSKERPKPRIPVLHYRDSSPPFIVCVKLDMTGGVLEETLLSLGLKEGVDYYHFN
ncbi:UDP-GlcNAc:betaGal beta-1,3-N-acetylglucosaminyltransferase-like protein 1 isoform X1 [Ictalurus punctatus]|uniref:UDP-GlcNAc:betaGal beta-1,3-N-acetylglucosaminyltransferase-like protein 1 isoform X1 n=1 Tax=Ictalurus punctatus TaxID=7998 RepID=A0A2D0Q427_ICTPU|nr:UDP-GlcNAc:betaGal beta-1,3-N-acetylglucosaminyltransferase-like protein 1 isoform X1 [Ictalurus punctatus]XP_017313052.1 UDP-GlcNAc:betaGal beta-1,3-N-acetylglucosaminyltransferase-like protein 1 isoform X1 [Ictalurus punctatus]